MQGRYPQCFNWKYNKNLIYLVRYVQKNQTLQDEYLNVYEAEEDRLQKDGLQGLNAGAGTDDSYKYWNISQWQK
jgi:hypothetical protein